MVFTLNWMVPPRVTLMSVANPWMLASPDPEMSHSLDGLPWELVFAHDRIAERWRAPALGPHRDVSRKQQRADRRGEETQQAGGATVSGGGRD